LSRNNFQKWVHTKDQDHVPDPEVEKGIEIETEENGENEMVETEKTKEIENIETWKRKERNQFKMRVRCMG